LAGRRAMSFEARLKELGITLPPAPKPVATYVPTVQTGNLLVVSGQVPTENGRVVRPGKLGAEVSVEEGQELARLCVLNGLAQVQAALGTLDRVTRVVRVGGFVASAAGFTQQPQVVNGASDFLVEIFGDAGRHARAAVGVAELPLGCAVEIEFLFEVAPAS
jgi:enamine deaminase RidA (YjgF/YER057c/UK114 family)